MFDLAIIGPYPPPYGGIATHICRLITYLKKDNILYIVYNHGFSTEENVISNIRSITWHIKFMIKSHNAKITHFHQTFRGFEYIY